MAHIKDILDVDALHEAIGSGMVTARVQQVTGHVIYNYSKKAPYTPGAWDNPVIRMCRGLIVSQQGIVLGRPWEKFFNLNEPHAPRIRENEPVEVTDKMDGSLGIVFWDPTREMWDIATRGSFDSEMAIEGRKMLNSSKWADWRAYAANKYASMTFLVEIIYPENRIVVDYGPTYDLVLLGAVHTERGIYVGPNFMPEYSDRPHIWPGRRAEVFEASTLDEALALADRENAEGLVVRSLTRDVQVKIKQQDYLERHKAKYNFTRKRVWEAGSQGARAFDEFFQNLPDEFQGQAHEWYMGFFYEMDPICDALDAWVTGLRLLEGDFRVTISRAKFAEYAKNFAFPHLAFMVYDNVPWESMESALWKMVKP